MKKVLLLLVLLTIACSKNTQIKNPINVDILMVKIGYLVPELYEIRGDWVMALTPGGVDQDLERLEFKRIKRPMFPFDKEMSNPDLSARLIELSN